MARNISLNFRRQIFAQESSVVPIMLVTITHPTLDDPIRLTSDPTERLSDDPLSYGTISRGNTFYFVDMQVALPDEQEASPPATKMVISNVDRSIIPLARSISSPASVLMECITSEDLETVEFSIPAMEIIHFNYNAAKITFDLTVDAMASEPYGAYSFTPSAFPGLFS